MKLLKVVLCNDLVQDVAMLVRDLGGNGRVNWNWKMWKNGKETISKGHVSGAEVTKDNDRECDFLKNSFMSGIAIIWGILKSILEAAINGYEEGIILIIIKHHHYILKWRIYFSCIIKELIMLKWMTSGKTIM